MASAPELRARIEVCMFDQYGTVVDMQAGLTEAVTPYLRGKGWTGEPHALVTWWRRTHFENSMIDALLQREHTPYREIGHRSLDWVLERARIPHTLDEVRHLVAQIERLRPFPEVPAALARLQTRFRIVVLSNGDPDMLEAAKAHHGIPFDAVISAAAANAFKPHVATYRRAAELIGAPLEAVLFVANHAFDCIGAKSAGMHAAFIDRRKRPFGATPHQPDLVVADMTELADVLVGPDAVPS
jgi:2-haloacid dehalogenase